MTLWFLFSIMTLICYLVMAAQEASYRDDTNFFIAWNQAIQEQKLLLFILMMLGPIGFLVIGFFFIKSFL